MDAIIRSPLLNNPKTAEQRQKLTERFKQTQYIPRCDEIEIKYLSHWTDRPTHADAASTSTNTEDRAFVLDAFRRLFPIPLQFPSVDELRRMTSGLEEMIPHPRIRFCLEPRVSYGLSQEAYGKFLSIRDKASDPRAMLRIRTIWTQMTQAERKTMLMSCDSNMPEQHRPDLVYPSQNAYYLVNDSLELYTFLNSRKLRLPYINTEDLSRDPETLLELVSSRVSRPPHTFAMTELLHAPFYLPRIDEMFERLDSWTTRFTEATDGKYALMEHQRSPQKARQLVDQGTHCHPVTALHILDTQIGLYFMLEATVDKIFESRPNMTLDATPPTQTTQGPLSGVQSTSTAADERATVLDMNHICTAIQNMVDQCSDHIRDLRDNPAYYAEQFQDQFSHSPASTPNSGSKINPIQETFRTMMTSAFFRLALWQRCSTAAKKTQEYIQSHVGAELDDKEYRMRVEELWSRLLNVLDTQRTSIVTNICVAPTLSSYFHLRFTDDSDTMIAKYKADPKREGQTPVDQFMGIMYLVSSMNIADRRFQGLELIPCMDLLDQLIRQHPEVKAMVTPRLADDFSLLGTVASCVRALELGVPRSTSLQNAAIKNIKSGGLLVEDLITGNLNHWIILEAIDWNDTVLLKLADPNDGKFCYPITEERTKETTQTMRVAEDRLKRLWNRIIDMTHSEFVKCGSDIEEQYGREFRAIFDKNHQVHRTPAWRPPQPAAQQSIDTVSQYQHDPAKEITGNFSRPAETERKLNKNQKQRQKAREKKLAMAERSEISLFQPLPLLPLTQAQAKVDLRTWKVCSALFGIAQEVHWSDFCYAMSRLGFSQNSNKGSACTFKLANRSIIFHEPHPGSKFGPVVASCYGRRLQHRFGWTLELFVDPR